MNTNMTSDITRAMARPSNLSRISARVIVRGPATPMPCRSRAASITGNARREQREQASGNEERQSNVGRRLAAGSIRERAVEQLADSEPEKEQRDDQLIVVRALDGERGTDRWKRWQHRVDRHRGERGERRHQGHELAEPNRRMFRGAHRSAQHTGTSRCAPCARPRLRTRSRIRPTERLASAIRWSRRRDPPGPRREEHCAGSPGL